MRYFGEYVTEPIKFLFTRKEAAHSLGVCVRTLDYLIAKGDLETKRIGKKILIPREVLRRYASGNHPEAVQG